MKESTKKRRRIRSLIITAIIIILIPLVIFSVAHNGRTDSSGGHYDYSTGEYHFHHGHPAHQHPDGICPYGDYEEWLNGEPPEDKESKQSDTTYKSYSYNNNSEHIYVVTSDPVEKDTSEEDNSYNPYMTLLIILLSATVIIIIVMVIVIYKIKKKSNEKAVRIKRLENELEETKIELRSYSGDVQLLIKMIKDNDIPLNKLAGVPSRITVTDEELSDNLGLCDFYVPLFSYKNRFYHLFDYCSKSTEVLYPYSLLDYPKEYKNLNSCPNCKKRLKKENDLFSVEKRLIFDKQRWKIQEPKWSIEYKHLVKLVNNNGKTEKETYN